MMMNKQLTLPTKNRPVLFIYKPSLSRTNQILLHINGRNMTELRHAIVHLNPKWSRLLRFSFITRVFRALWARILTCSARPLRSSVKYRRVKSFCLPSPTTCDQDPVGPTKLCATDAEVDADVAIKISLLGDCLTGKTCFMNKYVGNMEEEEQRGLHMTGLNLMDKILFVKGAKIAFSIWDVKGDSEFLCHVPIACKDSVAILIMFDLTSRCTLFNAICWYHRARKWNKTAIPILIGTKFDDFAQLPLDMQLAIVNEARTYARAMNATLFFSSSTHNINVNKIFKFIFAKLFNLPWTVQRNLTIGEPIIDF